MRREEITKVAIYARVSTVDKHQNPENQLLRLRKFCENNSWVVVGEFVDMSSGRTTQRPSLKQIMDVARNRECDALLVTKLDRFGRGVVNTLNMIRELDECGVAFIAIDQSGIDTSSSTGRFMMNIIASVAELETELIRERVMDGLARAKSEGKRLGRPKAGTERIRGDNSLPIKNDDILDLEEQKCSVDEICHILKISRATFYRLKKEFRNRNDENGPEEETDESVCGLEK